MTTAATVITPTESKHQAKNLFFIASSSRINGAIIPHWVRVSTPRFTTVIVSPCNLPVDNLVAYPVLRVAERPDLGAIVGDDRIGELPVFFYERDSFF